MCGSFSAGKDEFFVLLLWQSGVKEELKQKCRGWFGFLQQRLYARSCTRHIPRRAKRKPWQKSGIRKLKMDKDAEFENIIDKNEGYARKSRHTTKEQ